MHGDWHRSGESKPYAIVWMDDASRKVLGYGEFESAKAEYSIQTLQNAIENAAQYNIMIREVNTDRGSQFHANKGGKSQFQIYLESMGIKHVVSRKNNPQTNGKVERFWLEYDRHRWRFSSMDEFIEWYNRRIHGSLWLEIGENPNDAFIRKAPPESLLGLFLSSSPGGESHAFL